LPIGVMASMPVTTTRFESEFAIAE
jgi:hypothetical protein